MRALAYVGPPIESFGQFLCVLAVIAIIAPLAYQLHRKVEKTAEAERRLGDHEDTEREGRA